MKKIISILFLLTLIVSFHAKSSLAEDSGVNGVLKEQPGPEECLLIAINCGNDYLDIKNKIETLQNEISKGRAAYSVDELGILRKQLDNANKTLKFFENEGDRILNNNPGE